MFPDHPYSPVLALCDFYLLPSMKKHFQWHCFASSAEVEAEIKRPYERFRKIASSSASRSYTNTRRSVLWLLTKRSHYFDGGCVSVIWAVQGTVFYTFSSKFCIIPFKPKKYISPFYIPLFSHKILHNTPFTY